MGQFDGRRLSWTRLAVLLVVVGAVVFASRSGWNWFRDSRAADEVSHWFAGYVDVTATPTYAFEDAETDSGRSVVLGFVVADPEDGCTPTWGAAYTLDQAGSDLDLDRRIARLRQTGGAVAVSFGGQANSELAVACTDPGRLADAYGDVLDRYQVQTVDLDLEGAALADSDAIERRVDAFASLQKTRSMSLWLTLPVDTHGLTTAGRSVVDRMLAGGVEVAGVNGMTMDYGGPEPDMAQAATTALTSLHAQVEAAYTAAGQSMGAATAWGHVGATAMIGQNDVLGEVFGLDDAGVLRDFAVRHGLGRMSLWSLNRDRACGANYPDPTIVSDSCSGVAQDAGDFARTLGRKRGPSDSRWTSSASATPSVTPSDDPSTSPYPIWSARGIYLKGDQVVWHRNVYVARWWTSGDVPDDPLVDAAAAPWSLVGPVLPGESPKPEPTLAAGTYPAWSVEKAYVAGDRVQVDGRGFVAQWWTQGEDPLAPSTIDRPSPWRRLGAADITSDRSRSPQ